MTKSTITRERAQQIFLGNGPEPSASEERELARMTLAAMGSEPVAWRWRSGPDKRWHLASRGDLAGEVEPLYRHAQPVPEYPETLPCPVLLEPGLRFGKGIKTSTMLAALSRRSVYESDLAALSPEERAEFQAGIEDVKALIAQPTPVENHIGSKNALDAIVSFIKSKSNPTVKCYEEVSEQLFKDNCHGIHSHVIEYILKLGEELEDLRAEQDEAQLAAVVPDERDKTVDADDHPLLWSFNEGWNACRAAMLNGGKS
ncbi:TPA: hypothetical protein ACPUID_004745 [Klebsiella pneumoniae]